MGSIDRADWHYGADFPKNLPKENGGTHIGMYLNWLIDYKATLAIDFPNGLKTGNTLELKGISNKS